MQSQSSSSQAEGSTPRVIHRRRPRNDTQNRDYKCNCGKSYLSYPALYTHIKHKHPDQVDKIKKPGAGGISKPQTVDLPRGRPRVVKDTGAADKEDQTVEYAALSITELLVVELVEILKSLSEFKNKLPILSDNNVLELKDVREELKAYDFSVDYLLKQNLPLPSKSAPMKDIAVYFLTALQKHLTAYVYARIVILFHLFITSYQSETDEKSKKIDVEFFQNFINRHYGEQKMRLKIKLWEDKPKILQKVMVAFGSWMRLHGYVDQEIEV